MSNERMEWLTAYVLALVSALAASLYGLSSAAGAFGWIKAAGLFGAAFVGCHGPAWIVKAYRRVGLAGALFGVLVTAICFGATLLGGLGTNAGGSADLQADKISARDNAQDDRAKLASIEAERAKLNPAGTDAEAVAVARAAVKSAERARIAECGNGDPRQHGKQCRTREDAEKAANDRLAERVADKAATERAAKLDADAAAIRARRNASGPAAVVVDPQASAFAQLTGLTVATSAAAIAFWLSLAFELAAMFAMMIAYSNPQRGLEPTAHATQDRAETAQDARAEAPAGRRPMSIGGVTLPPAATPAATGDVARFMLACVPRGKASDVATVRAIYARYQRWCSDQQPAVASLNVEAFGRQFRALCDRLRIRSERRGETAVCVGVKLAS